MKKGIVFLMLMFYPIIFSVNLALATGFGGHHPHDPHIDVDQNQDQSQGQGQLQGQDQDQQQGQDQDQNQDQDQSQSSNNVNDNDNTNSQSQSSDNDNTNTNVNGNLNLNDLSNHNSVDNTVNNTNSVNNDVKNNNTNTLNGGPQTQSFSVINNSKSLGRLPETSAHGVGMAVFPLNDYGVFDTQFSVRVSVMILNKLSLESFEVFQKNNDRKGSGSLKWRKINKKIISSPTIINVYPALSRKDYVYYLSLEPEEIELLLKRVKPEWIVGLILYNSKFDKKYPTLANHLQMRSLLDCVAAGANICIPVSQFFQGYFIPQGSGLGLSGLLSWISPGFTNGQAVSPSGGVSKGQNTEFGRAGAAFLLIHVEDPEAFLFLKESVLITKKPEIESCEWLLKEISEYEKKCKACKYWSFSNMGYRAKLAYLYGRIYLCTGKANKGFLFEARRHNKIAEENYLKGKDIKAHEMEAKKILEVVYWNEAAFVREIYGRDAEISFAHDRGLERMPTKVDEIQEIILKEVKK